MSGENDTPRVWVGCLGCYNNGHLVGEWFDAVDAPLEMGEFLPRVFDTPGEGHAEEAHEELWVMDFENFHGFLTEECSPRTAAELGRMLEKMQEDGCPPEAVVAWRDNGEDLAEWDEPTRERFEEAYAGVWPSLAAYAEQLAEDCDLIPTNVRWPMGCIDWKWAARELSYDGYWTAQAPDGEVYVFQPA